MLSFVRTRDRLYRSSQLWMTLLMPFVLQWSLGGFENSSAVSLWAFTSPLGALLFQSARQAWPWFVAFVGLVAVSGAADSRLAEHTPVIAGGVIVNFFVLNIVGVAATAYVLLQYFVSYSPPRRLHPAGRTTFGPRSGGSVGPGLRSLG